MQLQNCVFPNFNLQILSSKSNLRSSFTDLFNFKFSKTCWKSPKLTLGRKVRRYTKNGKKKSLIFSWIRFFKLNNFQIWNLIKWSLFAVLPCKICNFLFDITTFITHNSLFEKTTAWKKQTFFCRKRGAPYDRASCIPVY